MSNESEDFAALLRQLTPAACGHLTEDTFYRAGWSAAVQTLQPHRVGPRRGLHSGISFASGLLCGLLGCVAAMTAWRSSSHLEPIVQKSIVQIEKIESTAVPPAALTEEGNSEGLLNSELNPGDPAGQNSLRGELLSLMAQLLPWRSVTAPREQAGSLSASRTLSVVAQSQWSTMMTEQTATESRDTSGPHVKDSLKAFPLSESAIRDLL